MRFDQLTVRAQEAVANGQKLALYEQLNDSIQKVLENAIGLLDLANKTRGAAQSVADGVLAQIRSEHSALLAEIESLTQERDDLRQKLRTLRDEVDREQQAVEALEALRESLHTEVRQLEQRHRQTVDTLQAQLQAINRLRDTLRETAAVESEQVESEAV